MKQNWEGRQQDTSQQGSRLGKGGHAKLRSLSSIFLIALVVFSSCKSAGQQGQTTSTNPPLATGTPNPAEIARQREQVSATSARCEALRQETAHLLQQSAVCCAPVRSSYDAGGEAGAFFRASMENLNRSRRKKAEALKQKADKLMEHFKTCEEELRTLAQSDQAEVKQAATLALNTLAEKLNEQHKGKNAKVTSSPK